MFMDAADFGASQHAAGMYSSILGCSALKRSSGKRAYCLYKTAKTVELLLRPASTSGTLSTRADDKPQDLVENPPNSILNHLYPMSTQKNGRCSIPYTSPPSHIVERPRRIDRRTALCLHNSLIIVAYLPCTSCLANGHVAFPSHLANKLQGLQTCRRGICRISFCHKLVDITPARAATIRNTRA